MPAGFLRRALVAAVFLLVIPAKAGIAFDVFALDRHPRESWDPF
jgi:hypothetical protein